MAEEIVGIKIKVDGQDKVLTSIRDIKTELKKAEDDAKSFALQGQAGAVKFNEAADRVRTLKKAIEDSTKSVQQFGAKERFTAILGSVQGIAGAFAAVTGAMGVLGLKGSETEKVILKVQSALALSQGIATIQQSIESFSNLGKQLGIVSGIQKIYAVTTGLVSSALRLVGINATTASVGVKAFSGALVATGIGAIVVGLGYLASSLMDVGDEADIAAEKAKKLKEQLEGIDDTIKNSQGYADRQVRLIKNEEKLKDLQLNSSKNQEEIDKTRKAILNDKLTGIKVELEAKKGLLSTEDELRLKSEKYRTEQELTRIGLEKTAKAEQDAASKKEKANEKAIADAQKLKDQEEKDRQERIDANKQADEDIRKAKQENYLATIKDEDERSKKKLEIDLKNRILEIDALNVDESKKRDLRLQAAISTQNSLDVLDIEIKNKQLEKDKAFADKQSEQLKNTLQAAKERQDAIREATSTTQENELFNLAEQYKKRLELVKGNEAAETALIKEYEEKKQQVKQNSLNQALDITKAALSNITNVVGRETAAGKALAVTTATIDTYQAANKALKADYGVFGPAAQIARFISVAATIGAGLKNVREITKAKVPGGGGGGGSAPSATAPISPNLPVQATLTQLNQGTINQLGSATNRAYVVESDVTNSQERIRRINRAARLN